VKSIRQFIGLATATLAMAACQSNTYYIKGEAKEMGNGTKLYMTAVTDDTQPIDSMVVIDGRFTLTGTADTAMLCKLYPASSPEVSVTFFLEPGNIYIELAQQLSSLTGKSRSLSRVSGTKVNNEWQALNDTVAKYDRLLRGLRKSDSIEPRKLYCQTDSIYGTLNRRINEVALRNRDNAMGRFIASHHMKE
jgi:hypothetical protein